MSEAELIKSIREVLMITFHERDLNIDISNLDMDTDLIEQLAINSMIAIEILVRIENVLDIEFDDENLSLENIKTIRTIVELTKQLVKGYIKSVYN